MSLPKIDALGLLILKFSELIDRIFQKRMKSGLEQLVEWDETVKKQFGLSLLDISNADFESVKVKLQNIDAWLLDQIISALYNVSISANKDPLSRNLKSNTKLDERIMELIGFAEHQFEKLSMERSNIKNCLEQQMR